MNKRLFLSLAAALLLTACNKPSAPSFKGVDLTGADYGRVLNLTDQYGKPRTLADFKGKVLVIFFGFTQCPDVCPTTMAEVAEVKRSLGADGDKVQGIFVTVDPERDTAELLKAYMGSFDPSFVALRGTDEQAKAVAKEFKIIYEKVPGNSPETYSVNHTAASFLMDTQGRLRVYARYGGGAQALADDVKVLLAEQ